VDAISSLDRAIAGRPNFIQARLLRAKLLLDLRRHEDALNDADKVLAIEPGLAEAWLCRANVLSELKRYEEALAACDRALALKSNLAEAWLGRGNVLRDLKRYDDASAAYDRALAVTPGLAEAWLGRGNAFIDVKRYDDAVAAYDQALALKPDLADAWLGRGNIFVDLKRYDEAMAAYDRALAIKPDLAEAWLGRGNIFIDLQRYDEAIAAYDRALAIKPDLAEAWLGRGNILLELKQYGNAATAYGRAMALKPDMNHAASAHLHAKQFLCDWTSLQAETAQLLSMVRERRSICHPFMVLAIASSAADQLQCARSAVQDMPVFPQLWRGEVYSHDRIRVAYLSADFYDHPVAHLAAGLFEHHDKSRFETTAISLRAQPDSPMRQRLKHAFEHFIDVGDRSDQSVAELMRRLEVDIAVDLMGFTTSNRLGILTRRAAPIQVNYLGYSGTMGAEFMD
jgi:tetratricopeptide (TPR) repeat protein